jgi:lysyl-tRNA synthetase class II
LTLSLISLKIKGVKPFDICARSEMKNFIFHFPRSLDNKIMATIDELRKTRIKKLEAIQKAGFLAYPTETKRTHRILEALEDFNNLEKTKKEIILTGRIKSLRVHGGATFFHIEDGGAKIQVFLRKDGIGEKSYNFFLDNFDIGDFIEVRGILFETKKGEKTLEAADFKMISKSLLPLPEKWHGLQDVEERYRKRYLDLIFNPEVNNHNPGIFGEGGIFGSGNSNFAADLWRSQSQTI